MTMSDPVDQARAWLEKKTGQRLPTESAAPDHADGPPMEKDARPTDRRAGRSETPTFSGPSSGQGWSGQGSSDPALSDPDADAEGVAHTIALRKLAASARTRHELDQALQKKQVPDEVAATVLDRLEEVGLVDDEAFAQSWVESRQQRRHLSRSALRRELRSKGVDRDHVDAALARVDVDDELTAARALAAKKASATSGLDPVVRDRRLAGALARRGFGSGIITTVLGELRDGTVLDRAESAP